MARHRLKNITFDEIVNEILYKAHMEYDYPEDVLKKAWEIAQKLQDMSLNRKVIAVSALYVACRMLGYYETQTRLYDRFGVAEASLRKYIKIIAKTLGVRTWLEGI